MRPPIQPTPGSMVNAAWGTPKGGGGKAGQGQKGLPPVAKFRPLQILLGRYKPAITAPAVSNTSQQQMSKMATRASNAGTRGSVLRDYLAGF